MLDEDMDDVAWRSTEKRFGKAEGKHPRATDEPVQKATANARGAGGLLTRKPSVFPASDFVLSVAECGVA